MKLLKKMFPWILDTKKAEKVQNITRDRMTHFNISIAAKRRRSLSKMLSKMVHIRKNLNVNASKWMYQVNVDYFTILAIHNQCTQIDYGNYKNTFRKVLLNIFKLQTNCSY